MEANLYSWTKSAQQFGQSLQDKLQQTTDTAINTVTTTLDQAQNSFTEIKETTSGVIETSINTYVHNFVIEHPAVLQLLKIINWAIIHPIISAVILLFIVAFLWSIIKGIVRVIETASWSIFRIPLKLLRSLSIAIFQKIIKLKIGNIFKFTNVEKYNSNFTFLSGKNGSSQDKQERLLAIYHRLELIHKEQQQLLQEAAELINS